MADTKFKKGHIKKGGKKKGSKNKFTDLKDEFLKAFYDEDGIEGARGIKDLLKDSPRFKMAFLQMLSKMLPSNMDVDHSGKIEHAIFMMPRPNKKKEDAK